MRSAVAARAERRLAKGFSPLGGWSRRAAGVARVAPDAVSDRVRPLEHRLARRRPPLLHQRDPDVDQGLRVRRQGLEALGPLLRRRRHGREERGGLAQGVVEMPSRDDASPNAAGHRRRGHAEKIESVADAVERELGRARLVQTLEAGVPQGDQVPGEVAAVDAWRRIGAPAAEGVRVVPVEEVTSVALAASRSWRTSASSRSTMSAVPIHPKSLAATVESSASPTFVGEVRRATSGSGTS